MISKPTAPFVVYVDVRFLQRRMKAAFDFYADLYPERGLTRPSTGAVLAAICRLLTADHVQVHWFDTSAFNVELARPRLSQVQVHDVQFSALDLVEHLQEHRQADRRVALVADDRAYPGLLVDGAPIDVLLRSNSSITQMHGVACHSWQDLDYVIAFAMGLEEHEL